MMQPRFTISNEDWQRFSSYIEKKYPLDAFNHDEKEFVCKALLKDGRCGPENRLWVTMFLDQLINYVDEDAFASAIDSKHPIPSQMQYLSIATCKALLGFFNAQHNVRLQVHHTDRTPEQQRLLEIHPNVENFPMQLTIDLGRLINVKQIAKEHPNIESKSDLEEKYLFQKLHNQLEEVARMQMNKDSTPAKGEAQEGSVQGREVPEWNPHSSEDTFLRLCTLKVWCDKYEQEEQWSPKKMVTEWLHEAIQLFNNVSYHWPQCKIKHFPSQVFHDIQHTCIHSWLHDIENRAGLNLKVKKPRSNFITDWCTAPVTDHRHVWETYCCGVILQAKNIAKLMGKHEVIHESELMLSNNAIQGQGEVQQPPLKRARSAGSKEGAMEVASDPSSELRNIIRSVVREEMERVSKLLNVVDRHDLQRHQEVMREMGGHITPLRTAVHHLSYNVNHMYNFLDQIRHTQKA